MEELIQTALNALELAKVSYGDIRVVKERQEHIALRNGIPDSITSTLDTGFGVRVIVGGGWGFAASFRLEKAEVERVVKEAVRIAHASARVKETDATLSEVEPVKDEYVTPHQKHPFEVPLEDKLSLLLAADKILRRNPDVKIAESFYSAFETKKTFASTEGAHIKQTIIETGGGIKATAIENGEVQVRSYPNSFRGNFSTSGYEFFASLHLARHAERVAEEAAMLLKAPSCPSGRMTIILAPDQLALQVHESIGHPIELDRVLGTEASYAGTSFLTLDKLGNFKYGSEHVNVVADATVPGGLGTFGYDDEGVRAQRTDIIKEGIFVGYLTSRETAPHVKGKSNGTMRADGWARIPLIRMTNINLLPGEWELEDLIADTDDGLFLATNRSWSIDDKRLNFQFGTEIAWQIEKGKLTTVYKNPTYTGITPEFWNACDAVCSKKHWKMFGTPNCGKGEPGQAMHVGHGTAPARFRNVEVGVIK